MIDENHSNEMAISSLVLFVGRQCELDLLDAEHAAPGARTPIKGERRTLMGIKLLDLGDGDRDLATREQSGRDHGAS